jgi:hypothetical protein
MGDTGSASGGGASPDSARPADAPGKSFEIELEGTPLGPLKGTVRLIEPPRGKPPSPWVTELPRAVITLLTASVVGGLVSMAFNYKSWRENQRIDRAKTEMTRAQTVFNAVNELTAQRIHRTLLYFRDIVDEGRTPDTPEDAAYRKTVETSYRQLVSDWNAKILLMIKQVEFDIDFAVKPHDGLEIDTIDVLFGRLGSTPPRLDCRKPLRAETQPRTNGAPPPASPARPDQVDWNKAYWVLSGIHICFVEMSSKLAPKREEILGLPTPDARRAALKEHDDRLNNLRQHAMTFTHVAARSLRSARNETQTRDFWEYIKDW